MRCMFVWSAGSETAKTQKINMVLYSIAFVLCCIIHVLSFTCNMHDDKNIPMELWEHLLFGIFILTLLGWLTLLMLFSIKYSYNNIKENKLIPLYLLDMEQFVRLGEIPYDMFILFSNENGVVLAMKEYENESRCFSFGAKYFYEFVDYYDKYAVRSMEFAMGEVDEWNII